MEPGEVTSPRAEASSQQSLWPLFALAGGLVGVGGYGAWSAPTPSAGVSRAWEPVEVQASVPRSVDTGAGVRRLGYAPEGAPVWRYALEQRVGEGARETQVRFVAREERGGGRARWSVDEVSVRARVSGEGVAGVMSARLEEAVSGAEATGRFGEDGRVEVEGWAGVSEAGGVDVVTGLMGDGLEVLRPRLRAGEVRVGERWSYTLDVPGGPAEGIGVRGGVRVDCVYVGEWEDGGRRYVVVAQRVEVSVRGERAQEGERVRYEIEGEGEGVALLEEGEVWRSGVRVAMEVRARGEAQRPQVERRELTLGVERVVGESAAAPEVGE